ncbi:hypothetical protein FOZ62_012792 [Perkinsus olseni]|uniref:Uncharacterized protein n=1 Tax=Perkinsus olseni TaxID=32597 RepID=A0A7J6S914_PEROL|nr:hypothetical protein FOZ62_012792 [Perkinsus olseni]
MRDSLLMVAERTFPDKQVEPAAVHQGKLVRRLMMMHDMHELNLTRKRDKYKFKKYSGVIRNRADHWRANIMPWVWRSQKVNIPPPLMVRKKTGAPPDTGEDTSSRLQPRGRPHYYTNVSHWLFPTDTQSGFKGIRRTAGGRWVGQSPGLPKTQDIVKPRH